MKRRARTRRPHTVVPAAPLSPPFPPYPPSWFDRLKGVVERLPGPFWLPYLLLWLGLFAVETLLHWQVAALPVGAWSPLHGIVTAIVPGSLCLIHALDRLAQRSFDSFRPVLHAGETEVQNLRYQLSTLPRGSAAVVVVAAIGFGVIVFLVSPAGNAGPTASLLDSLADLQISASPLSLLLNVALLTAIWAAMGTLVYHTVRRVDATNLRDMDALNKAIASLEIERNLLNRIPTWPWQPESLRTVIVALLLPIFVWLAQQLLSRFLAG